MKKRVVITGMGVVSPNAIGLENFEKALKAGKSGIRFYQELADLNFRCQIAGKPDVSKELIDQYFTPLQQRGLNSTGIVYGVIAGTDAWKDAGLNINEENPDYDSGIIFGNGTSSADKYREAIYKVDAGKTRRLGSSTVVQIMTSGISAYLSGILGCGNQVTTNSSACSTGTEALLMGCERIQLGKAERMLVGSCSDSGPYIWGGFDAIRVLPSAYNDKPDEASRPLSSEASGFVPGSGAGALVLESLESAKARGAKIYAEVLGGAINNGGQRNGGTMTAANPEAVQRCISQALDDSKISSQEIDAINGHLTATAKDPVEIKNWSNALKRKGKEFPYINSIKGMIGHCITAAGSIENVASVLQIKNGFLFGNKNCNPLHPEITAAISEEKIPKKTIEKDIKILAKASFGFGDVNAVAIFKKFKR